MKAKATCIRLEEETRREVDLYAERKGITMNEAVERLVVSGIRRLRAAAKHGRRSRGA